MNNESAIEFYKKFGFEVVETYPHYYKRIEPADAHVLQKTLKRKDPSTSDSTNGTGTNNQTTTSTTPKVNGVDKGSSK